MTAAMTSSVVVFQHVSYFRRLADVVPHFLSLATETIEKHHALQTSPVSLNTRTQPHAAATHLVGLVLADLVLRDGEVARVTEVLLRAQDRLLVGNGRRKSLRRCGHGGATRGGRMDACVRRYGYTWRVGGTRCVRVAGRARGHARCGGTARSAHVVALQRSVWVSGCWHGERLVVRLHRH